MTKAYVMNLNIFTFIMLIMLFMGCKKAKPTISTPEEKFKILKADTSWKTNNLLDPAVKDSALKYLEQFPDRVIGFRKGMQDTILAEIEIVDRANIPFMDFEPYYRKKILDPIAADFRRMVFRDSLRAHSCESISIYVTNVKPIGIYTYTEQSFINTIPLFLHERFRDFALQNGFSDYQVLYMVMGQYSLRFTAGRAIKPSGITEDEFMRPILANVRDRLFPDGNHNFVDVVFTGDGLKDEHICEL